MGLGINNGRLQHLDRVLGPDALIIRLLFALAMLGLFLGVPDGRGWLRILLGMALVVVTLSLVLSVALDARQWTSRRRRT
jgi:hypothetical protein